MMDGMKGEIGDDDDVGGGEDDARDPNLLPMHCNESLYWAAASSVSRKALKMKMMTLFWCGVMIRVRMMESILMIVVMISMLLWTLVTVMMRRQHCPTPQSFLVENLCQGACLIFHLHYLLGWSWSNYNTISWSRWKLRSRSIFQVKRVQQELPDGSGSPSGTDSSSDSGVYLYPEVQIYIYPDVQVYLNICKYIYYTNTL